MISILCFDISKVNKDSYDILYNNARPERQSKAERYNMQADKIRCVVADALLRYAVNKELSVKDFDIGYNSYSKPYIENQPDFHYNISHSGKWVVIAYGKSEVGVDIEKIYTDKDREKLILRHFTKDEQDYIFSDEFYQNERFYEVWTAKESYLKYLGTGLRKSLNSFSVIPLKEDGLYGQIFDKEYYLSVFSLNKISFIQELDLDKLLS